MTNGGFLLDQPGRLEQCGEWWVMEKVMARARALDIKTPHAVDGKRMINRRFSDESLNA